MIEHHLEMQNSEDGGDKFLRAWREKYAQAFDRAASQIGEELVGDLPEAVQASAYRFCVTNRLRMEDIQNEVAMMAFTIESITQTFETLQETEQEIADKIIETSAIVKSEIQSQAQAIEGILGAIKTGGQELSQTVRSVLEVGTSTHQKINEAGDTAYKTFKSRIDPATLKADIANGAALLFNKQVAATIEECVERAIVKRRYLVNTVCAGLFLIGVIIGKYFLN